VGSGVKAGVSIRVDDFCLSPDSENGSQAGEPNAGLDRTSFAPETIPLKRNERDRNQMKTQQNQQA
jgi:hypothetical protein